MTVWSTIKNIYDLLTTNLSIFRANWGDTGSRIVISVHLDTSTAGTHTLYTVPANKVFYLTCAHLSTHFTTHTSNENCSIRTNATGSTISIIKHTDSIITLADDVLTNSSINPSVPIKMTATQVVSLNLDTNIKRGAACVIGYEEDA